MLSAGSFRSKLNGIIGAGKDYEYCCNEAGIRVNESGLDCR